jgi:hypothetical protein
MELAPQRDLIGVVYRALVRDSLVPSDANRIGRSAVAAIARRGVDVVLPPDFGADVERDAAFLAQSLPSEGPWWDVLTAMAWDSGVAHTAVTDAGFPARMMARLRGEPLTAPGFFLCRQSDGRLAVADVDPAGSGHACGLRAGDVVLTVDGRPARRANSEVLPFYTASPGARFDLAIERDGVHRQLLLELLPGDVPCVTERRLAGAVGHLRIRWFATSQDPRHDVGALARLAVASMVADGAAGIVIDVRSGLGGLLSAANDVISLLCDAAILGAHRTADDTVQTYPRTGPIAWPDARVAVLVNEQTISAAEYLALGLEELAGATLVGTPTAGGLNAIRFIDLADGYRLALPSETTIGPRSRAARPGFRLQPRAYAANPTVRELAAGVDPALETARRAILDREGAA